MSVFRAAISAYPIEWHEDWQSYENKLSAWVKAAADEGAALAVFPEYGAMELASLGGQAIAADLEASIRYVSDLGARVRTLYQALADAHNITLIGASMPVFLDGARPVNRVYVYRPGQEVAYTDKQIMTRFERAPWGIVGGQARPAPIDTPVGRIGIITCYDSEFPLIARRLCEAGAEVLIAPSCTETLHGYHRVRIGSMARALENQCYVLHAPLIGQADWSEAVDDNHGAAGVYTPPDIGFPETGICALGQIDVPGWIYAEIDLNKVRAVRADGGVLNFAHWTEQG